jgi:hypothetical protein
MTIAEPGHAPGRLKAAAKEARNRLFRHKMSARPDRTL